MSQTEVKKQGVLTLIAKFFGIPLVEMRTEAPKLTELDKQQLASAIARQQGLTQAEVSFVMVDY